MSWRAISDLVQPRSSRCRRSQAPSSDDIVRYRNARQFRQNTPCPALSSIVTFRRRCRPEEIPAIRSAAATRRSARSRAAGSSRMVSARNWSGSSPSCSALGVSARVQPALELRAVDLGMELEREVPAEPERLHPGVVAGQHRRRRGRQAAVAVELQPGPGRDQFMIGRFDQRPADLLAVHGLDPPAQRGAERLGAEADAEHRHARLVRPAQPGQFLGDPGVGIVDRADRAEHHHVVDAVERGQRAVIGKQVDGQRGAARLERVADEAGRIDAVVPDTTSTRITLSSATARPLAND